MSSSTKLENVGTVTSSTASGAAAGTAVAPGYGTAIGAGLGFLGGLFSAWANSKSEEERMEALRKAANQLNASYDKVGEIFDTFYETYSPGGSQADIDAAARAISDFDPTDYLYGDDEGTDFKFSYDKSVEDFLNPYYEDVIDKSNRKVSASAAGSALGRGTGAAQAISENTTREYDNLYNTALNQYQTDRSQAYTEFTDYISNMQKRLDSKMQGDQWKIGQQRDLGNEFLDWQSKRAENEANLEQAKANARTQLTLASI